MAAPAEQTAHGRAFKIGYLASLDDTPAEGALPRFHDVRDLALAAENAGLDSFWVADHFIARMPNEGEVGQWEAFTFLSALAAVTTRIQLGPLVAATSFRNPALTAKMADSLDEISNGRFIMGLGAGWHEPEYLAFGYPFDHLASRFEEALQIIVPLLREGKADFHGEYVSATDAVLRPRGPSPKGPPILIGARRPRMLRLVARYADAWNTAWHTRPDVVAERWAEMRQICEEAGRDPATLELTAGAILRLGPNGEPAEGKPYQITGTTEEIAERLRGFVEVGARHLTLVIEPEGMVGFERFLPILDLLNQG
ncbi:MAG TPA: LLM class flavin-dependent oxidoreductase [Ktedonobacterales bacterium]|nr:LLM class flavin-dependent oxidoreductase [Ktedonobacterales bacterium]